MSDNPVSEQFRLVAKDWVEKDSAANLLEETKSARLNQMMMALGDMPVPHAEREVKSPQDSPDLVTSIVEARKAANLAKVKMEYIRRKFSEWQSAEANARSERRL